MQTGTLISFSVANKNTHAQINRFCREFYGYEDKSNKGKYTYKRPGFLHKFPHIKVQRGLIIIHMNDTEEIINYLNKYSAKIFMREIILVHSDLEELNAKLNKKHSNKDSDDEL